MREMTDAEIDTFLMTGTRTGKLATVRSDGRPHVAPIWFVTDGRDIIFNTHAETVKGRNMAADNRVSLSVDDENAPYAFVLIEGTVTLSEDDPADTLAWATRIGGRYMGQDRAEEFGTRNAVPGEYVVRLTPTKRIGRADLAG